MGANTRGIPKVGSASAENRKSADRRNSTKPGTRKSSGYIRPDTPVNSTNRSGDIDDSRNPANGDINATDQKKPQAEIQFEAAENIKSKPTPKATAPKKGRVTAKAAQQKQDSSEAARGLIEMVELFAMAKFGPEAAFTFSERFFIEQPLARLIEKYGNVANQFSGLIDPALVAIGVVSYGVRLARATEKSEPDKPPTDDKTFFEVPPMPKNSNSEPPSLPTVDAETAALFANRRI